MQTPLSTLITNKLTVTVRSSARSHADEPCTHNKVTLSVYSNPNLLYILTLAAQNCLAKQNRNQNHRQRSKTAARTHIHCSLIAPAFFSASVPTLGPGQVASRHLVQ